MFGCSENTGSQLKLQRVDVFCTGSEQKATERPGQVNGAVSQPTSDVGALPSSLVLHTGKSPCCFLVFNLKQTPACENPSPPDAYRSSVIDSSGGGSSSNVWEGALKSKRLHLCETCS